MRNTGFLRGLLLFCLLAPVFGGAAAAQVGVTCTAFVANQPMLRQEGNTESAGDILVTCAGTLVGAQTGAQTMALYINGAAITSRQLYTGSTPSSIPTEASLLVNDCTSNSGVSSTGATCSPSGTFTGGNPTQGFLQSSALVFSGFTLPTSGQPFQLRITNVRVNANSLSPGAFVTATVLATIGIQNQQGLVLGAVQSSLSVSVSQPIPSNQQCGSQAIGVANLTVKELMNTAFKSPAGNTSGNSSNTIPGNWYQFGVNNESQTVLNSTPGWTNQLPGVLPGLADAGTRLRVNFTNVPPGVTLSVPVNVSGPGGGSLVVTASGDLGPFFAASGTSVSVNGSGSVTYEVRSQNSSGIDAFTIPVTVTSSPTSGAGTLLVSMTYAATGAETGVAIPRFTDTSVLTPAFNFLSCLPATHLAFVAQPVNGVAGTALPPVSVQALDAFGNVTATNPQVTLTSSPAAINTSASGVAGMATFSGLVFNSPGTYTFTASSAGLASVASQSFIIRGPAATILVPSPGTARYGQSVTLTASVSPLAAAGTVTFYDGTAVLGTAPLSNGQAQLTTSLLAAGARSLQARYNGNTTYSPSLSAVVPVTVNAVAANSFQLPVNYTVGVGPASIAVSDVNRDGIADLVVADNPGGNVAVRLGNGDGTFRTPSFYGTGNQPVAVAIGDFNGDGNPDIATANSAGGTVSLLLGKGDGTFLPALPLVAGPDPMSLAVADFNGDGLADLVVVNFVNGGNTTTNVSVFLGNGDGTFQSANSYIAGIDPNSVAVGDFNRDGNPDVAVANLYGDTVSVFLGNGDGTLQTASNYSVGAGPQLGPVSILVADLNGDGFADLATANLYGNSVTVMLGKGDGTFNGPVSYAAGSGPYSITTADFNGDGKADLLVADISSSAVSVLLGNGNGTFQAAVTYSVGLSPESVVAGDFNNDGKTDMAVANFNNNNVSVLLGTSVTAFSISGRVTLSGAGLAAVSVTLGGSQSGSTSTDSSGNYSFNNLAPAGNYTVTPNLPGFVFTPPSQSFAALAGNQSALFAASPAGTNLVISGQVTVGGVGLGAVGINLNGSQTASTTTDSAGNYALVVPRGGSYTVSAALIGYSFSPPAGFSNLTTNQIASFSGIAVAGLEFYPVTPCRLVDTRIPSFQPGFGIPSMQARSSRTFPIPSNTACGIPSTAAAYSLNLTVVTKGYLGYLTIWPTGQPMPNASTLNSYSATSTAVANAAIVPAGANGAVDVYSTDATDVIIDIDGYFAPPAANGLAFYPIAPCRLVDTRVNSFPAGFGPPSIAAASTRTFTVPSNSACAIPSSAAAYSLNVTAVPQNTLGFLSIWPAGKPLPNVSTLNVYTPGTVVANAAIVPAGTNGAINAYVTDATDLVIDIDGYFAPLTATGLKFYGLPPCRVADTRAAAGFTAPFGSPTMAAATPRSFPVAGSACGIPSGAGAYSFNFTAVPQSPQLGIFITWPTGQAQPNVSTMNSYNGSVVSNAAILPAGSGGAISVYVTDKTDVLFDVNGYFAQ